MQRNSGRVKDLGLIDYQDAYVLQKQTVQEVLDGGVDTLLLCEHFPVYTLGRIATTKNLLVEESKLQQEGIQLLRIDRGGEITFHGPGQIIIYPIINLSSRARDLRVYMNKLEQVAIDLLRYFGIVASRLQGHRGVWVKDKKIASIGIGIRRWVSFHGMAINISTDLGFFSYIKPCGLNVTMTSMEAQLGKKLHFEQVKKKLIQGFCESFEIEQLQG